MRLYLDEDVERRVADELRKVGHNVYEVTEDENARGKGVLDKTHALGAQRTDRVLITQDGGYGKLREHENVPSTGVIYAKPSIVRSSDYEKKIVAVLEENQAALERGAFITVDAEKVRVRELEKGKTQEMSQSAKTAEQERDEKREEALRKLREQEEREDGRENYRR